MWLSLIIAFESPQKIYTFNIYNEVIAEWFESLNGGPGILSQLANLVESRVRVQVWPPNTKKNHPIKKNCFFSHCYLNFKKNIYLQCLKRNFFGWMYQGWSRLN